MRIILMGPPGAGKGTQVSRLAFKLGVPKVSSGDLFRDHQRQDTELGRLASCYMEKGGLVPDSVTIKMIMDWINAPKQSKGLVLDGFPRTLAQAKALDLELEDKGGIDKVLFIKVSEEELVRRLTDRLTCRQCQMPYHRLSSPPKEPNRCDRCKESLYQREDDQPEAVANRILIYKEQTEPLVQYYRESGKLTEIDGEDSIEKVERATEEAIRGQSVR